MRTRYKKRKHFIVKILVIVVGITGLFVLYRSLNPIKHYVTEFIATQQDAIFKNETSDLRQSWRKVLAGVDQPVEIAVYNEKTGTTSKLATHANTGFKTASIVKVSILGNLLRQHAENGTSLSPYEDELAQAMIKNSDNDAATILLEAQGTYAAPDTLFDKLGMHDSHMSTEAWGYSTTSALDQVTLLKNVFYKSDVLTAGTQAYMQRLMNEVSVDQSWGVTAGVGADGQIQLKNGWLDDEDGSWIINSIGHVSSDNTNYVIAVLTEENDTEDDGSSLVEQLSRASYHVLNKS